MGKLIIYIFFFLFPLMEEYSVSYFSSPIKTVLKKDTLDISFLPKGAMPFKLDRAKRIYLDVVFNDSIKQSIFFDSGAPQTRFTDSLYNILPNNIIIKANSYTYKLLKTKKRIRSNYSVLGCDFFNGKIIEINYEDKYLLEHMDVAQFYDYDRVKITRNKYYLLVPASVNVQGKTIKGNLILDTGGNAAVTFSNSVVTHYNIDLAKMDTGRFGTNHGWNKSYYTLPDTIRMSNSFVTGEYVTFLDTRQFYDDNTHIGLLGNDFLSHFSVVLDLKNDYMYLKKR